MKSNRRLPISEQERIQNAQQMEMALLNGAVILNCSKSGKGLMPDYAYVVRSNYLFYFYYSGAKWLLWKVERYDAGAILSLSHLYEYLYIDRNRIADLDLRKMRYGSAM